MSTRIATLKGRYEERSNTSRFNPAYREATIYVTRFWGGEHNGRMIQLTTQCDKTAYVQLTQEQIKKLSEILKNCFNDEMYPSE